MAEHRRLHVVANLYAYGIILVVLGHSLPSLTVPGDPFIDAAYWVRKLIYAFHMPLFFFISGYIFTHTRTGDIDYLSFVKKKAVRLLVPYFFLNTAAYPIKVMLSGQAMRPAALDAAEYLKIITDPSQATIMNLWFLPTLFVIFLAAPFLRKAVDDSSGGEGGDTLLEKFISLSLFLLFIFNPFRDVKFVYLCGAAEHIIFFWFGCLYYRDLKRDRGVGKLTGTKAKIVALIGFCILCVINLMGRNFPPMDLMRAWLGIIASYFLVDAYTRNNLTFLKPLEGYTYTIFLLSWFPQVFVRVVFYEQLNFNFFIAMILMIIGGLAVPVFLAKIVERYIPRVKVLIGL